MEYLDKDLDGSVQTSFHCSAEVACFDVSPQHDYMVCECRDGTIHLWSLRTGEHLWQRWTKVRKDYYRDVYHCMPFEDRDQRDSRASFYRSVVFHPTDDLVLPGILSQAYTFEGELRPLFPSSECRFSVCSISTDKSKMLTVCPHNAKLIIMWNLTDGSEILHYAWKEDILSFAWSCSGWLLAISTYPSGSICLVDMMDGFKTLAQTKPSKECGMIKVSPDCRFLFGLHLAGYEYYDNCNELFCLHVKVENQSNFSLDVFSCEVSYYPWEFESSSETGFLLGDPFCYPSESSALTPAFAFVLNKQSVLNLPFHANQANVVKLLYRDELMKDTLSTDGHLNTVGSEVAISLNGDTFHAVTGTDASAMTLKAWDISRGKFKAVESTKADVADCHLTAVREGILCLPYMYADFDKQSKLQLWNFEFTECIRSWTDIGYITSVIPISEEWVACVSWYSDSKVIILDTTSGDVSTITIRGQFVACNSKCQVITTKLISDTTYSLQMECGEVVRWKIVPPFRPILQCNTFSPTEQYCVVAGNPRVDDGDDDPEDVRHIEDYFDDGNDDAEDVHVCRIEDFYVLDAVSGRILHMLCSSYNKFYTKQHNCKFLSDEECVINICHVSRGNCIRMFNIKSGDLLSEITMESEVCSLAACPRKSLIAIGLKDSKHGFKLLHVKLPQDKNSRKNKRIKLQE
ncbi:uncharacterized protein LOC144659659 [Oculina patagonica]